MDVRSFLVVWLFCLAPFVDSLVMVGTCLRYPLRARHECETGVLCFSSTNGTGISLLFSTRGSRLVIRPLKLRML